MQLFSCTPVALLGFVAQWVTCDAIIGYDGKEHHWHPHRDGLHDHALHEQERHRRHDLSHPRLRRFDSRQLPHMLNQHGFGDHGKAPIIVRQHNLHIASHERKQVGFGVDSTSPKTLAKATGNATEEAAMHLSRMEKTMMDSVFEDEGVQAVHFRFRAGHKQTEQNAAEDLTAQEVQKERERRQHNAAQRYLKKAKAKSFRRAGGAPAGAAPAPVFTVGAAPGPAPMASPAAAPGAAEEEYNDHATMDEDIGAQEQGFSGEIVQHDNMKTMTTDFRKEYGPGNGLHSYVKICAMYPDNQWCHDRGYHRPTSPPKSASMRLTIGSMFVAVVALSVFA